jgi:hypothetical protein
LAVFYWPLLGDRRLPSAGWNKAVFLGLVARLLPLARSPGGIDLTGNTAVVSPAIPALEWKQLGR